MLQMELYQFLIRSLCLLFSKLAHSLLIDILIQNQNISNLDVNEFSLSQIPTSNIPKLEF